MVSESIFQRPPEAPVYRPTEEEFSDPMTYIKSIRPTALKWGICKIIPPSKWMPPFALDVDHFEFPTRIQKLSELGAQSRVKYIFYEKVAKFWDLQGLTLTIPVIEKRAVDLYGLHSLVKSAGGANVVTRRKRWQEIAKKMGFVNVKLAGSLLRRHYERILRPYDKLEKNKDQSSETNDTGGNSSIVSQTADNDSLENCVCFVCNDGSAEERVLLCDGCDGAYHTFCLDPPLKDVPPGDWLCPQCLSTEVSKPLDAYGFEQADRMYTLLQFGEMADRFKTEYFNMLAQDVPLETVEKEFWRIVSSVGESVTVEYGADLHAMDHGSAFPTMKCLGMNSVDGMYAQDKWNLNNIPVHKDSALRYLKADLSGMKIPWMYVGMCFSTFCWHTEDHWNYSINYMHWGEAKTWYGVPGSQAELFEETFRKAVPELFTSHPDVLHHLVTLMHPNTLMQAGVSVCRTDQFAGEFVITFPKAYHAGFNQGYNFAEAVNFALPDWLSIGRECVRTYSLECRHLVFSHDELVCSIAANADNLSPELASETVRDMHTMIEEEKELRHVIGRLGVVKTERVLFELVPDDERQCEVCKTTCFLSAITCSCKSNTMVCLRHYQGLCDCPPDKHVLKYRYSLQEVGKMKEAVGAQYLKFKSWTSQLRRALDNSTDYKKEKIIFKKYLEDGKLFGFFDTAVYQDLEAIVEHGDNCSEVLRQIFQLDNNQDNNKDKIKTVEKGKFNLTLEELEGLQREIERLPFVLEGSDLLSNLITKVRTFKVLSYRVLNSEDPDVNELNTCIDLGENIEILLPEMPQLKKYNLMFMWLNDMKKAKHHQAHLTLEIFKGFLSDGVKLPVNARVEKFLSDLQALTVQMECWENRVNRKLQEKSLMKLAYIKERLSEAEAMNVYLPSAVVLREILHKSSQWISQVKKLDSRKEYPYETTLEKLVQTGSNIPAHLVELPKLELRLSNAKAWKSKASRIFLRKNSHFTLMDALAPRVKFGLDALKICRTESDHVEQQNPCVPIVGQTKFDERLTTQEMVEAFSLAADNEINSMNVLRLRNKHKRNGHTIKTKYCICRKPLAGVMLECQLCRDLFHRACVPCSKSMRSKDAQDIKYLCPCCLRSRRPRLETILSLLVDAHHITVRIPEVEALQCLTKRAMEWQLKARQMLDLPEVAVALAKLSILSQKKNENKAVAQKSTSSRAAEGHSSSSIPFEEGSRFAESGGQELSSVSDHCYLGDTPRKMSPVVVLCPPIRKRLEDVMMLGDLLEISLDESYHIWRVLQASKSPIDDPNMLQEGCGVKLVITKRMSNKYPGSAKIRIPLPHKRYRNTMKSNSSRTRIEKKVVQKIKKSPKDKEERCGAPRCVKPKDKEIDWVQCDGPCKRWFHLICVGLEKTDIKQTEDFYCGLCSGKKET